MTGSDPKKVNFNNPKLRKINVPVEKIPHHSRAKKVLGVVVP
jgi:hypothetical protein